MRYIDTEPLLKEINRIEEEARKVRVSGTDKEAIGADGKVKLCLKLKFLIDSLRQEQNERHYTKVREIKTGKEFLAEYSTESAEWYEAGTGNAYSISDVEIVKEQQEVDLEKEIDRFFEEMPIHEHENIFEDTYQMIARHFYELGQGKITF